MSKRIAWLRFSRFLTLLVILSMVTTGCGKPPKQEGAPVSKEPEVQNPLATPENPPYPGPYKTVLLDGVEYKQGRFAQGDYGGSLVRPIIGSDPKTFNYWAAEDAISQMIAAYAWSGLFSIDAYSNEVIPELGVSYEVMPDHLTYVTHLRKGMKWSDGKPITSEDVAFTFNEIIAAGLGNSSLRDTISVEGKPPTVTVVDELTNKFVTAKPFAPFLRSALTIPIAPKHVIDPLLDGDARKKFAGLWAPGNNDLQTLVTSGPFAVTRYVPGQRVELSRTKNFYMIDPHGKPLPYLDKMVFLIIQDVATNLLKFKGSETDITQVRNKDAIELAQEQDKLSFKLHNLGQESAPFLMFNMNQRKNAAGKPYVTPYKSVWFNDVNFRQAINHALNRQQMVDGYLRGIGVPAYSCEQPSSPFFNKELQPIKPDLEYSKSLLAKSGFQLKPDGSLYDKDGHAVEFDLQAAAGGTMASTVCGYIANDLKKLGIKVNYQELNFNVLIDKVRSQKDWDVCFFSLSGDPAEPNNGANVWLSDGTFHLFDIREPGTGGKITVTDARPWEQRIDELFAQGVQEFDHAKRVKIYDEYQKIIYDEAPFIYLIAPMQMVAVRNKVGNYQPTSLAVSQLVNGLHNIDEIFIVPDKKPEGEAPQEKQ